jgi:hypothetical protein
MLVLLQLIKAITVGVNEGEARVKSSNKNQKQKTRKPIRLNSTDTHLCSVAALHRKMPAEHLLQRISAQNPSSDALDVVNAILGLPSTQASKRVARDFLDWTEELDRMHAKLNKEIA